MDNKDLSVSPPVKHLPLKRFFSVAVPVLLLLLCGAVAVVYFLGEQKVKQAAEEAALEKQRYERSLDDRSIEVQRADIRLFAVPLAWAVRRELMQENYGQIDEYFSELVRKKQFKVLMLLDPEGTVRIASDRKLQGSAFSGLYPGMDSSSQQVVSYPLAKGSSLFLVPVMGLNARIGTIAFVYSFERLSGP
ncbi:MAG: hypothetical protein FJZ79_02700 [Chlorobi bacterium]|nr:hypothetical protein [Chlorobiota bacterium]